MGSGHGKKRKTIINLYLFVRNFSSHLTIKVF